MPSPDIFMMYLFQFHVQLMIYVFIGYDSVNFFNLVSQAENGEG